MIYLFYFIAGVAYISAMFILGYKLGRWMSYKLGWTIREGDHA